MKKQLLITSLNFLGITLASCSPTGLTLKAELPDIPNATPMEQSRALETLNTLNEEAKNVRYVIYELENESYQSASAYTPASYGYTKGSGAIDLVEEISTMSAVADVSGIHMEMSGTVFANDGTYYPLEEVNYVTTVSYKMSFTYGGETHYQEQNMVMGISTKYDFAVLCDYSPYVLLDEENGNIVNSSFTGTNDSKSLGWFVTINDVTIAEFYMEWSGAYIDGLLSSQTIVQHANVLGISIDSAARYTYSYPTSIEPITVPSIDATWYDLGKYNLDNLLEYIYDNPMDDQTGLPAQFMF